MKKTWDKDNIQFRVYYKESNNVAVGYTLKHLNRTKINHGLNYAIVINNKEMIKPSYVRVVYEDKVVRLVSFSAKGTRDFIFLIKTKHNINQKDEE